LSYVEFAVIAHGKFDLPAESADISLRQLRRSLPLGTTSLPIFRQSEHVAARI
jgi:hypothetical protein